MNSERVNKRIKLIVRWSPLLLAIAATWAVLSWRHIPLSIAYILACVAVGLMCGALIVVDYWKNASPLVGILWLMVFISAPMFLNEFFFADASGGGGGHTMSYQYMSVTVASILGVVVLCRGRLTKRFALDDAEQTVGREAR